MHEKTKLAEAKYFCLQMSINNAEREKFIFNLSAFLSAARSVTQYALEEARNMKGGQTWYDRQITNSSILSFFRDKRDLNIHGEPIHPTGHFSATYSSIIGAGISIIVRNPDGNIEYQSPPDPLPDWMKPPQPHGATSLTVCWMFMDWPDKPIDVLTLSQKYIGELESFVADGTLKGFLKG